MIFLRTTAYTELVARAARAEGVSYALNIQVQSLIAENERLVNAILSMQKEGLIVQPGHNDPAWEPYIAPMGEMDGEFDKGRLVDPPDDGAADEDPELEEMMIAALHRAQGGR